MAETHKTDWILYKRNDQGEYQQLTPSCLNYRASRAFERHGLPKQLAKRAASCNNARHYAVSKSRKRRALTQDEIEEEQREAKMRLSSRRMAEEVYDQPQVQ